MDVDLPEVESVWVDADDLDALLRTIPFCRKGSRKLRLYFALGERAEKSRNWKVDSDFLFRVNRLNTPTIEKTLSRWGFPCCICGMKGLPVAFDGCNEAKVEPEKSDLIFEI